MLCHSILRNESSVNLKHPNRIQLYPVNSTESTMVYGEVFYLRGICNANFLLTQPGAPWVAKLVYNSNNYGFIIFKIIASVMGFITKLTTGGPEIVNSDIYIYMYVYTYRILCDDRHVWTDRMVRSRVNFFRSSWGFTDVKQLSRTCKKGFL